ncbi:exodeoxyribonuclease VII large subunit, partial [Enterococcus faecium]|uniref:exodeoxyribonuclease VII large subunit n=1 Tax=Enterococcus faecium TaxID=1352 RepID=UPI003CC66CDE
MKQQQQRFAQAVQSLDLLSPLKILGRGYSYTTLNDQVVKSVSEIHHGDLLTILYQDGIVKGQVQEIDNGE